jgi:hypothetical protein
VNPRNRLARNRDLALTTLIDLLVQVVFVFTLILVSAEVIEGDPRDRHDRGWVTPEAWKTLISIFDVDPEKIRGPEAQLSAIKEKYDDLREDLRACDAKVGACAKPPARGPGYATCLDEAGAEMVVADASIDFRGGITVGLRPPSKELQERQPLGRHAIGTPLSVEQFGALFRPWREHGLARLPACAFKVEVTYDPRAPAGSYEPARRAIANYFTLSAPPRQF